MRSVVGYVASFVNSSITAKADTTSSTTTIPVIVGPVTSSFYNSFLTSSVPRSCLALPTAMAALTPIIPMGVLASLALSVPAPL